MELIEKLISLVLAIVYQDTLKIKREIKNLVERPTDETNESVSTAVKKGSVLTLFN